MRKLVVIWRNVVLDLCKEWNFTSRHMRRKMGSNMLEFGAWTVSRR